MVVPENIYQNEIDFTALALQHSGFAKRLKSNGQLDFSDPETVRQLTKALLRRDFDLSIQLPEDRLCPPVPNRFNYVNFTQKLLDTTRFDYRLDHDPSSKVLALDIGTGASAIYPLLACRQRSDWYFLATEIDATSRQYAQQNIKTNGLSSNIRIVDTDPSGQRILPSNELEHFDDYTVRIMLTNPPFYSSEKEMLESAQQKSRPPNSACTGAPVEMITTGGEVQFVSRIIRESMLPVNRSKIQWFSSMLGKYSSISIIIERLQVVNCTNYAVTEFVQGQKTRRWCVAWSWTGLRPPVAVARGISSLEKKFLPFPSEYEFDVEVTTNDDNNNTTTTKNINTTINKELSKLDLAWCPSKDSPGGLGISSTGDVWSRKARRRANKPTTTTTPGTLPNLLSIDNDEEMKDVEDEGRTSTPTTTTATHNDNDDDTNSGQEPALVFSISIHQHPSSNTTGSTTTTGTGTGTGTLITNQSRTNPVSSSRITIAVRWIQGQDSVLFESFCGWLKRRVDTSHTR